MSSFSEIRLEDRPLINRYFALYPHNEGSEYSFTNLFIWAGLDHSEIYEGENKNFLLLRVSPGGERLFLMALAKENHLKEALLTAIAISKDEGFPFAMRSLPEWYCQMMQEVLPDVFPFSHEPYLDDYIYLADDLINLRGNKFHGKRNHINRFMRQYGDRYEFMPYSTELREGCLSVYREWLSLQPASPMLHLEQTSVVRELTYATELELKGGVILVDGKVAAFSMGECLTPDMAVIHSEKASPAIPELFTVINREFAAHAFSDMMWINREEDMGSEGLRRAKRSYNPVRMVEKYRATLRGE